MIRLFRNLLKRENPTAVVLMYHRISEYETDPWDLCVTPSNFDDQLRLVKKNFDIIPMHHLAGRLLRREPVKGLASITFDDGYQDNYDHARKILLDHNIPATFFFTTLFRQSHKKYWWDELEQLILREPILPEFANMVIGSESISSCLSPAHILSASTEEENRRWRYGQPPSNSRLRLFVDLWTRMKEMRVSERNMALEAVKVWACVPSVSTPPIMTEDHIRDLTSDSLFEAGAHSVNHPALGTLTTAEQKSEIEDSKRQLEDILAHPVSGFAYPYGHYDGNTPKLVEGAGFRFAVTTCARFVARRDSPFEIPRYHVRDVTGTQLLSSLSALQKT